MIWLQTELEKEQTKIENAKKSELIASKQKEDEAKRNVKVSYILQKDINWFGRTIRKGTEYRQVNSDYWHPIIQGNQCPSLAIDFYTVKNNEEYFIKK